VPSLAVSPPECRLRHSSDRQKTELAKQRPFNAKLGDYKLEKIVVVFLEKIGWDDSNKDDVIVTTESEDITKVVEIIIDATIHESRFSGQSSSRYLSPSIMRCLWVPKLFRLRYSKNRVSCFQCRELLGFYRLNQR
jgi:hypothetical protein